MDKELSDLKKSLNKMSTGGEDNEVGGRDERDD
jgi:hypothetical protein